MMPGEESMAKDRKVIPDLGGRLFVRCFVAKETKDTKQAEQINERPPRKESHYKFTLDAIPFVLLFALLRRRTTKQTNERRMASKGELSFLPMTNQPHNPKEHEREDSVLVPVGCVMVGYVSRLVVSHGRPTN